MQNSHADSVRIIIADLSTSAHREAVLRLVDAYSQDPMGDGKPLSDDVRNRLIPGLREHPTTLIFLAYEHEKPVGIAVCFRGFSTFAARPLINIHDLNVLPDFRGRGISQRLLGAVEHEARASGCCKLTLEVQENNRRARRVYAAAGFAQDIHREEVGGALFYSKFL
jgi:GNAT superfamily N-acetyltransferase